MIGHFANGIDKLVDIQGRKIILAFLLDTFELFDFLYIRCDQLPGPDVFSHQGEFPLEIDQSMGDEFERTGGERECQRGPLFNGCLDFLDSLGERLFFEKT